MQPRSQISPLAGLLLGLYSFALALVLVVSAPWWLRELRVGGKYREGLGERFGRVRRAAVSASVPGQRTVWVHAVSVGEVLAAAPLVQQLRAALPGMRVLVSTTTRTGQAVARARFGADTVFYYPADLACSVRAWLRHVRPALVVLVESEFWPRFLYEARRAGVAVAVVNARVSPRSWPRYQRLRVLWRPLLGTLALAHAQAPEDAERLRQLGARQALVGGNLKYDVRPPRATPLLESLRRALPDETPVLVCGSTLAGEEAALLGALPPKAVLLLAPRHPERFEAVAQLLARGTRPWHRLSTWRAAPQAIAPGSVLLLDSVGELAALYALATVAIVGGGFLHTGGHNPLEPALLGKPVLIGPGFRNFADVVATMQGADAVVIAGLPELAAAVEQLLAEPARADALGARAQALCAGQAGATARAVAALTALVQR